MVAQNVGQLDLVFSALADPTRRAILERLAQGEATVNELVAPFGLSQPTISKHLKVLEGAGLIERSVEGRIHRFRLRQKPLREAERWIARHHAFWTGAAEQLERLLAQESGRGG